MESAGSNPGAGLLFEITDWCGAGSFVAPGFHCRGWSGQQERVFPRVVADSDLPPPQRQELYGTQGPAIRRTGVWRPAGSIHEEGEAAWRRWVDGAEEEVDARKAGLELYFLTPARPSPDWSAGDREPVLFLVDRCNRPPAPALPPVCDPG